MVLVGAEGRECEKDTGGRAFSSVAQPVKLVHSWPEKMRRERRS